MGVAPFAVETNAGVLDLFPAAAPASNVFCPTGTGGGVDPSCPPGRGGADGGNALDAPVGRSGESARDFFKRVNRYEETRPDHPDFHDPARVAVERRVAELLRPGAAFDAMYDPRLRQTVIPGRRKGDFAFVRLGQGGVEVHDNTINSRRYARITPGLSHAETEYRLRRALRLKVDPAEKTRYGLRITGPAHDYAAAQNEAPVPVTHAAFDEVARAAGPEYAAEWPALSAALTGNPDPADLAREAENFLGAYGGEVGADAERVLAELAANVFCPTGAGGGVTRNARHGR